MLCSTPRAGEDGRLHVILFRGKGLRRQIHSTFLITVLLVKRLKVCLALFLTNLNFFRVGLFHKIPESCVKLMILIRQNVKKFKYEYFYKALWSILYGLF